MTKNPTTPPDDMTLRATATPTNPTDPYPWKATTPVLPHLQGNGDTPIHALTDLTTQIRTLYHDGPLQLTNPNLEINYTITKVTATISLGINPNHTLTDYTQPDQT